MRDWSAEYEVAAGHDRRALGPAGDRGVVADEHEGQAAFPPELLHQSDDLVARLLVEGE